MTYKANSFGLSCILFVLIAVGASVARAASLHISTDHAEFHAYHPVSVTITLTVDATGGDRFQYRNEREVPVAITQRRFRAILRDDSNAIQASALLLLDWRTPEGIDVLQFGCQGIGFFVASANPRNSSSASNTLVSAGRYSMVVIDRENSLESNPIQIKVVQPNAREQAAADVLLRTYPEGIRLILMHESSNATVDVFRELAEQYQDTDLGRLASLALALRRGKLITKKQGGTPDPSKWKLVANDISAALENLPADHPLHAEALFKLCAARARSGQFDKVREVLARLEQKSHPKGKWAWLGRRIAEEMKVLDARKPRP